MIGCQGPDAEPCTAVDHNRNHGYSQHIETRISKKRYNDRLPQRSKHAARLEHLSLHKAVPGIWNGPDSSK
jgi:hypothetical protein